MEFQVGKPVTGEDLIGRDREKRLLAEYLKLGQSVIIIAPRRYGKTSLILDIISELKDENYYTAYIDLFSIPDLKDLASEITATVLKNKNLDRFFKSFKDNAVELIKNIQFKAELAGNEFILGFSDTKSDIWSLISDSLDYIDDFAIKNGKKMVCGFDEFGDIGKLDGNDLIKLFRSKIQLQKKSTYVFAGSYESVMNKIFISRNSPFYRFARIINLGPFTDEESRILIDKKTKLNGISLSEKFINSIIYNIKGHPYYLQLFLQQMIIINKLGEKTAIPEMDEVVDSMLSVEKNFLETSWNEISYKKEIRLVLLALVSKNKVYGSLERKYINVSRALKMLSGKGIVRKNNDNTYELTDPLFEIWIKKNILE